MLKVMNTDDVAKTFWSIFETYNETFIPPHWWNGEIIDIKMCDKDTRIL